MVHLYSALRETSLMR